MMLRKVFLSTVSAMVALSAGQQMAMAADRPAADNANALEEIVVTARKREENILDTPIAITAFTGESLAAQGITDFSKLADATPGINITGIAGGGGRSDRSFQQITLRGFVPSTTLSTLTATFIDGVPVASPTAVATVSDPARIEILKGPQAAYFGRNTFAGAVNVVNKQPGQELGGSLSLMGGTRSNVDFLGSVDGPLFGSENYGFRVGVHYFKKDGSYNNPVKAGQTLGDQETKSVSLFLTAKPFENFSAKLFTLFSKDHDGPSAQGLMAAYEARSNNGVVNFPFVSGTSAGTVVIPSSSNCSLSGFRFGDGRAFGPLATNNAVVARPFICGAVPSLAPGFAPAQNTLEDNLLATSLANPLHRAVSPSQGTKGYGLVREYKHAHLNLDYQFGETGFTLSSLTGLNAEYWSEVADLDNYDTRLFTNPIQLNPATANPNLLAFWDFRFGVERETYDFSQELRLSYDHQGPFSGVFGVSYLKTKVWNNLINLSAEALNGTSRAFLGQVGLAVGKNQVKTQSAFFGGTYKFNDAWKFSLEGRYQQDEVGAFTSSSPTPTTVTAAAAAQYGVPAGVYGPGTEIISIKFNNFLPRAILQYDVNPNVMTYLSYSKGVNVGTNTINTAFLSGNDPFSLAAAVGLGLQVILKPEELTNYELGLKGKFLDNRLQLQVAVYQAIWSNQLNTRSSVFQHPTLGTQLVSGPANTGEAKLQGVEVELVSKPVDHLELSFAAAMTDSKIRSFEGPTISQLTGIIGAGFKGKQLPESSKYSMNLGVQYGTPLSSWDDGSWFARADLSWKDKQFADAANLTWIKSRTVVNLRAGVAKGPLGFDVFVNNAFNDKNFTGIINASYLTPTGNPAPNGATGALLLAMPELRTVGARISYKF